MKTPPHHPFAASPSAWLFSLRSGLCLASLALLTAPVVRVTAASLYWDANGTTAEAGSVPSGTWGSDSFWNSDATGAAGGSFTATTTSADSLYFSAGPNSATGAYTVNVSGTQAAQGVTFNNKGEITVSGGTLAIGSGGITAPRTVLVSGDRAAVTISANVSLQANQTWLTDGTGSGTLTVSGNTTGTGNLTLTQSANRAFTVSGNLNYTGSLTTSGGNAAGMTVSGNIGSTVTDVRVTSTAVLRLSGNNAYSGDTLIGGANFTNPVLRVGSDTALAASTTVILSTGGASASATLDLGDGANSFNATVAGLSTTGSNLTLNKVTNTSTGTGTATLTINPDGKLTPADSTFSGIIQNGTTAKVALTKAGGQKLTLNGANTYTGATRVTGGTLALGASGSISANSALTVGAGAVFDAQALSSYAFSTATTTTIGVGAASAGQIKAAAATFTNAGLGFDFGATTSLLSSYTVLVNTGATGHFASVTATGTSISGSFIDGGAGNWTLNSGGYTLTFNEGSGALTAVLSSIPEPSTYAVLAGAAGLTLAACVRRRRRG